MKERELKITIPQVKDSPGIDPEKEEVDPKVNAEDHKEEDLQEEATVGRDTLDEKMQILCFIAKNIIFLIPNTKTKRMTIMFLLQRRQIKVL